MHECAICDLEKLQRAKLQCQAHLCPPEQVRMRDRTVGASRIAEHMRDRTVGTSRVAEHMEQPRGPPSIDQQIAAPLVACMRLHKLAAMQSDSIVAIACFCQLRAYERLMCERNDALWCVWRTRSVHHKLNKQRRTRHKERQPLRRTALLRSCLPQRPCFARCAVIESEPRYS